MKGRYPSLDGFRGFAALLVVLNHINGFSEKNWVLNQLSLPLLQQAYDTLAAGATGVQIFFVLSGFLIAFFYAEVRHPLAFIQKRYTRIFPVFITVVTFLWIVSLSKYTAKTYMQVLLLPLIVVGAHFLWKYIKRTKSALTRKRIFFMFLFVQTIALLFAISNQYHIVHIPKVKPQSSLFFLSNSTLTFTMFPLDGYEQVFWSLVPEVLFYLLYPVLIIHLITVGKRSGAVVSVLLILFVSCLLLYLDHVIPALSLGRASSYIAGVVIGTIYYTKSKMWTQLESILKIPFINVLILFSFLFVLWGDMYFRAAYPGVFSLYSLYYFYVSSWIISLVILASIVPDTLFYKIFSNKILVFLGLISFAMYLIHPTTIRWNYALYLHFVHFNHHDAYHIAFTIIFITTVITTVAVSYFIHKLVERLYFEK